MRFPGAGRFTAALVILGGNCLLSGEGHENFLVFIQEWTLPTHAIEKTMQYMLGDWLDQPLGCSPMGLVQPRPKGGFCRPPSLGYKWLLPEMPLDSISCNTKSYDSSQRSGKESDQLISLERHYCQNLRLHSVSKGTDISTLWPFIADLVHAVDHHFSGVSYQWRMNSFVVQW